MALTVVPANAGTHNHRCLWQKVAQATAQFEGPRSMGRCVRRDDERKGQVTPTN